MMECYCDRCMGADPPCDVTGDHDYGDGGTCKDCGHFNGALLAWRRIEKAEAEGRHHGNHYHRTTAKAKSCHRKTHDEMTCADNGGCYHHDPSEEWLDAHAYPVEGHAA